jgi:hypothetical protein
MHLTFGFIRIHRGSPIDMHHSSDRQEMQNRIFGTLAEPISRSHALPAQWAISPAIG